jgi:acyl dehydratase
MQCGDKEPGMTIPTNAVGRRLEEALEVEPRRILAYAAGIGSSRDCYLDDLRPEGVIAPPAFCVVAEWGVLNGPSFREAMQTHGELTWRRIHVHQDTTFHRPIRAPGALQVRGRIVQVRPTRAGAFVLVSLSTHDARTGALLASTWWGAIYRGIDSDGACLVEEAPPLGTFDGSEGECTSLAIPRWLPHVYTECAQIWNPIHTERKVAVAQGLPDIILHGTATWALAGETLIDGYGDGDPVRLRRLACRFKGPVVPGTHIVIKHAARHRGPATSIAFAAISQKGEPALTDGIAEFQPPAAGD